MTTPLVSRPGTRPKPHIAVWMVRLQLAVCLGFGSEVLLWTDVARAWWLWLPLIAGYVAIAALLLDLLVRFQVRELFGLLVLAGIYALLASWSLNPAATLQDLPIHLMTRVMGAQFAAGVAGIGLFIVLLGANPPKAALVALSGVVGALWGIWVSGHHVVFSDVTQAVSLASILIGGTIGTAAVLAMWAASTRAGGLNAKMLRLSHVEWVAVVVALVLLLVMWATLGTDIVNAMPSIVALLLYCVLALWFQANSDATNWLDHLSPMRTASGLWLLIAAVVFLGAGATTFQLSAPTEASPGLLAALSIAFGTLGLVWLPAVSLVLGLRAYRRSLSPDRLL